MIKNKKGGFSFVELVVVIAILAVLAAVFTSMLIAHVEKTRIQKDESAMDSVKEAVNLALCDADVNDEAYWYNIPNNFITYSDSSGIYAQKEKDEQFWAPDGSGPAVTITLNPDKTGHYDLATAKVNNMIDGNGSTADYDSRAFNPYKQVDLKDIPQLYSAVNQTIGSSVESTSRTYKQSSYTLFVRYDLMDGTKVATVSGEFNGTNLAIDSPSAIGSGVSSYDKDGKPVITTPKGGTVYTGKMCDEHVSKVGFRWIKLGGSNQWTAYLEDTCTQCHYEIALQKAKMQETINENQIISTATIEYNGETYTDSRTDVKTQFTVTLNGILLDGFYSMADLILLQSPDGQPKAWYMGENEATAVLLASKSEECHARVTSDMFFWTREPEQEEKVVVTLTTMERTLKDDGTGKGLAPFEVRWNVPAGLEVESVKIFYATTSRTNLKPEELLARSYATSKLTANIGTYKLSITVSASYVYQYPVAALAVVELTDGSMHYSDIVYNDPIQP